MTLLRRKVLGESCRWFQLGSGTGLSELHPAGLRSRPGFSCRRSMAPEQAPREGVAESLSLDNKTGNPPLLEGLLSQTSSPDWLFLPSGISLALGQWMALMETLTFRVSIWRCSQAFVSISSVALSLSHLGNWFGGRLWEGSRPPSSLEGDAAGLGGCALVAWAEGGWPSPSCIQKRHHCSNFGRAPAPLLSLQSSSSSCLVPSPSQEGELGQNLHSLPRFSA